MVKAGLAKSKRAPGPRGGRILGNLSAFQSDPIALLMEAARDHGDVVRFEMGPVVAHLIVHPDGIKRILQDNNHAYGRHTRGFDALKETLGDSMLTVDGDFWRRQRRIAQPAFHKQRISGFAGVMADAARALVDEWRPRADGKTAFDVTPELLRVTLRILGLALFGIDLSDESAEIGRALTEVLHHTMERTRSVFHLPHFVPTPKNRRFKQALRTLDRVVLDMIAERRRKEGDRGDLLSMLMAARDDETGERMDDRQLRNELLTILLAGHETTAMSLTWTLALLGRYPSARRRVEEEAAAVLGGRRATLDDLPRLAFCKTVIEESMRLFPPAWVVARSVEEEDEIGGFAMPKGSIVFASPWVTHRRADLWPDPEGFDPDRFRVEDPMRARYAYFPFGGGPHLCIGAGFAMLEAQIVLATIAGAYSVSLVPGHPIVPEPLITLRPKNGVKVVIRAH